MGGFGTFSMTPETGMFLAGFMHGSASGVPGPATPYSTRLTATAGVTVVVMFVVRQMSPYRPMSWLAGETDEADSGN